MSKHMIYLEEAINDVDCEEITNFYKDWKGSPSTKYMSHIINTVHDYVARPPEDKRAEQYLREILKICLAGLYKE